MGKKKTYFPKDDRNFTKTDMERLGIFKELGYHTIGDPYHSLVTLMFNKAAYKGRQIQAAGWKLKDATQAGYFAEHFLRVFDGESYSDPIQLKRMFRNRELKKNVGPPFKPTNGVKMPCGLGSYCATINPTYPAMSPLQKLIKRKGPVIPTKRNFIANPGKKGTGYGYAQITIAPYPEHMPDSYNVFHDLVNKAIKDHHARQQGGPFKLNLYPKEYFDENPYRSDRPLPKLRKSKPTHYKLQPPFRPSSPAKKDGGMKAGTIGAYPEHSADIYTVRWSYPKDVRNNSGRLCLPPTGPKSMITNSIQNQNILKSLNTSNYKTLHSIMAYK